MEEYITFGCGYLRCWGAIAKADIFISLDGEDLTDSIVLGDYPGQFILAVEGNTIFEPNDISVEVVNGTLDPVGDSNTSYYFQFNSEGEAAVNITTKVDMTIDGQNIPADTLIYQLWLYYNSYVNLYAAFGIGLAELSIPPEEEDVQQGELPSDNIDQPTEIITEEEPNATESMPAVGYNLPPLKASERELRKVLLNCPNIDEEIISYKHNREEIESLNMSGEGCGQLLLDGVIEVSSDITTNQIWTANNVYYITSAINVQALLVIEPGTIIEFAYDTAMYVNNGGTLISSGMPDNPIIYTCDFLYPDWGYYWEYLPDYGNYYFCPVYIEETATPATTVTYSFIEGSLVGIVTNNITLDHPIENNYLIGNIYGIGEYGTRHTDITNNLCYFNDTSGIDVHLADINGVGDANSIITISNNTSDSYQYCGITIHGVEIEQDAGWVVFVNNIVSESYQYGISLVDNYLYASVLNTGYYGNPVNKNWEFDEYNPVFEDEMPYVDGIGILPICYLQQDCNFVNNGFEYIEQTRLIGKTTDVNCFPDSNIVDLGFHYPNWDYSNAGEGNTLTSDLNHDLVVNFLDFAILAADWQSDYNINDLNTMSDQWLQIANAHPPIAVTVSDDPNNLMGDVDIGISGLSYNTTEGYIYVDGELMGYIDYTGDSEETCELAPIKTQTLGNGQHDIKAVTIDVNGLITVSQTISVDMNNDLYYVTKANNFNEGEDYHLFAMSNSPNEFRVKLVGWDGTTVWTSSNSSGGLNTAVPSNVLTGQIYNTAIEMESGSPPVFHLMFVDPIKNRKKKPGPYKVAIFLPNGRFKDGQPTADCRMRAVAELIGWCEARNMNYIILYKGECTWNNFAEVLSHPSVNYVYIVAHGGYYVTSGTERVNRMWFYVSGLLGFGTNTVVSYKGGLPGYMDINPFVHSMNSLGLYQSTQIRLVYMTVCHQGSSESTEMAEQWLDWSMGTPLSQLFCGWESTVEGENQYWKEWDYDFWHYFGSGDNDAWWVYNKIQLPSENLFGPEIAEKFRMIGWDQVTFTVSGH